MLRQEQSSIRTNNIWRQENKTVSLTIKNYKIMVKKNEKESPRALNEEELESVNGGGGGGGNRKRKKYES